MLRRDNPRFSPTPNFVPQQGTCDRLLTYHINPRLLHDGQGRYEAGVHIWRTVDRQRTLADGDLLSLLQYDTFPARRKR